MEPGSELPPPPPRSGPPPPPQPPPPSPHADVSAFGHSRPPEPTGSASAVLLNDDESEKHHFRRLIRHPWTLLAGAGVVIAAYPFGRWFAESTPIGIGFAVCGLLVVLFVVWSIASSASQKDFFTSYAKARGLSHDPEITDLPEVTPLLELGYSRHAIHVMTGALPGGAEGTLSLYTYNYMEGKRNGVSSKAAPFTVVIIEVPTLAPRAPVVYCRRRPAGSPSGMKELRLESAAFEERYEVHVIKQQDENWMRQLFSPSFIVWLAEGAPDRFAWELSRGNLCVNVFGHLESAAELDELCEAAARVATRLVEEAAE